MNNVIIFETVKYKRKCVCACYVYQHSIGLSILSSSVKLKHMENNSELSKVYYCFFFNINCFKKRTYIVATFVLPNQSYI